MDARTIFTPSHTLPWGSSIWRLHRHGGVPTRLPVNLSAFKAPWKPTRRFGCLKPNMECVAWKQGRFLHRHEPVVGGCSGWRLHRHEGVPTRHPVDLAALKAQLGPIRRLGCLIYSMECVSWVCGRFNRRHEPPGSGCCLVLCVTVIPPRRLDNASPHRFV